MRIIEWNSQGAFRKKHEKILSHNPDILIIPECESEENLKFGKLTPKPNDFIWYGDSANKGIGIFSYSDFKLEILTVFNPNYRYIVPLRVSNPRGAFILLAIWAMDNKEFTETRYIGQIWLAINFYKNLLNLPIIITGDFNSNKIWDSKERVGNHTDMVNLLAKNKINSIYHSQEKEEQGKEENPTFHMYRKKDKPDSKKSMQICCFWMKSIAVAAFRSKRVKSKQYIDRKTEQGVSAGNLRVEVVEPDDVILVYLAKRIEQWDV